MEEEEKEITVPVLVGTKRTAPTNLNADATIHSNSKAKQLNFSFTFQQEIEKATKEVLNKKPKIDSLFSTLHQRLASGATSATSKVVADGSTVSPATESQVDVRTSSIPPIQIPNINFPSFGIPNSPPSIHPPSFYTAHLHPRNNTSEVNNASSISSIVNPLDTTITSQQRPYQIITHPVNFPSRTLPDTKLRFPLSDNQREIPSNSQIPKITENINVLPLQPIQKGIENHNSNRFVLLEEPHEIQRKSYGSENRCILPNPLTVSLTSEGDERNKILDGFVIVKLVNKDGSDLPTSKQNALECIEGQLKKHLDEDHCAHFPLKILTTSEGSQFRLLFHVEYRTKSGSFVENIWSTPFGVYSNKNNRNSKKKKEQQEKVQKLRKAAKSNSSSASLIPNTFT